MIKRRRRKKPPEGTEKEIRFFKELCEVLESSGIETRVERGKFRGGFCVMEGEKRILFLNKKHPIERRIAILVNEVKKLESDTFTLPDSVKAKLDEW